MRSYWLAGMQQAPVKVRLSVSVSKVPAQAFKPWLLKHARECLYSKLLPVGSLHCSDNDREHMQGFG